MLQIFIICAIIFIKDALTQEQCEAENQYDWSFHGTENGPEQWKNTYPNCGRTTDQSPIEFSQSDVLNFNWPKLQYTGFDTPITQGKVKNEGWSLLFEPLDDVPRFITFMDYKFNLKGIHFHFGPSAFPGAGHIIDGMDYEMEIHYYLHQEDNYDQIGVIASRIMAGDENNAALQPIFEVLSEVLYRGTNTDIQSDFTLADLLPEDAGSYYYYQGSNDIPPCQDGFVYWVLKNVGTIGDDDLDKFMTLYSVMEDDASESCLMGPNVRPTQNLNRRAIIASQ